MKSIALKPLGQRCAVAAAGRDPAGPQRNSAKDAALRFYQAYNARDMSAVLDVIDDHCVYQDLIYQDPFVGRKAIAAYFEKVERLVPKDVKFVVEDITDGDPKKVGVRWHVELEDVSEFPFSRGVSFYEVNDAGKIVFARDLVEPALKPGAAALRGISLVAPLVRRLGPAAQPANLPLAAAAASMWAFWAGYVGYVLLSTSAPGLPAWRVTPEALQEVLHESCNFFYVNIALAQAQLNPVPCVAEHPVAEALFNFVNAWSMMMLPAWIADPRGQRVQSKLPLWGGTMLLTNVFLPIYMAKRLEPHSSVDKGSGSRAAEQPSLPAWAPAIGAVAVAVGGVSLYWALAARPEYGGLAERIAFFQTHVSSDRVFWAFCVDAGLYSVWQAWLLGDAGAAAGQRWIPFFGMAAWLLQGPSKRSAEE